jgi:hypothetical protein
MAGYAKKIDEELDALAGVATKLGLGANGYSVVGRCFKQWPSLKAEPQKLAWYFSRLNNRKYSKYEDIQSIWAYLVKMINEPIPIPGESQGGDSNYYRQEKTIFDYCNPILGHKQDQTSDFTLLAKIFNRQ